jgi:ABC-type transport system involved in cytochrome bd biosynthesis fused ATPase/permease subunit
MEQSLFLVAALFRLIFAVSFHLDRSRYRNCYLLFAALVVTELFILSLLGDYSLGVTIILLAIIFLVILTVPVFLIMNGIVMFRREGHSPANLLSFVFGIVIGVGELATTIRNQRKIKNSISRVKA